MENIKKLKSFCGQQHICSIPDNVGCFLVYTESDVVHFCRNLAAGIESGKLSSADVIEILRGVGK